MQDDFSAAVPGRWTIVDEGKQDAPSAWSVHRGAFAQTRNIYSGDAPQYSGTYALAGDAEWTDYTFSLILRSQDNDGIGVMFRYADAGNYYRFRWSGAKSQWNGRVLERVVNGKWTVLASDNVGYTDMAYHNLQVRLAGEQITLYLDDPATPVFAIRDADTPLRKGRIGLYSWGNTGVFFDNVAVYANDAASPFPVKDTHLLTVTGRAFVDGNRNGAPDAGEAGLPGLIVSDGAQLAVTDATGAYTLHVNPFTDHFVFVVTPSGYRILNGFYRRVPEDAETLTAHFAFAPAPETAKPDFTFAHITDIHVSRESDTLLDDLKEISRLQPAFIIATGDLVESGLNRQSLALYRQATEQSPAPVINGIGNHDATGGGIENYEEYLGPTTYAFDYGGRLFILFNDDRDGLERRYEWLRQALALQPPGKEILFFQHHTPDARLLELLAQFRTLAVYSGHWHMSKVFSYGKGAIKYVNSPSLRFGGIDANPRGFRLTTFAAGTMTLDTRASGVAQHCVLVCPADGVTLPQGPLVIEASAYDSGSRAVRVEYRLDDGPWKPLAAAGSFHWAVRDNGAPGEHIVRLRATFADRTTVERHSRFTIADRPMPIPRTGQDWPMFQRDAARSGRTPEAVMPPLLPVWRTNLGGTTHFSSPVVVGGVLYIGAADEDDRGKAGIYALDTRTGAVRWHFPMTASVKHTVAVAHGLVYAVSVDGQVFAVDTATGQERWRYSLGSPLDRWVYSAPVVLDGSVYVGSGASVAALDAVTGTQRWHTKELGSDWMSQHASPAATADLLVVSISGSKGLSVLERATGKVLWNKREGLPVSHGSPTVADGLLVNPTNTRLSALNLADGSERWSFPLPGGRTLSSPVIAGGNVFIGAGDGQFFALDLATGKTRWRTQTGSASMAFVPYSRTLSPVVASPVVAGNIIYLGGVDGKFCAYDAETGNKAWEYQLGAPITASAAISGNTVYISTYDGTVYAFTQAP